MSGFDPELALVALTPSRSQPSWTSINHGDVLAEHLSSPDLDELDKKYRWMLPDLVDSYKQAAFNPALDTRTAVDQSPITRGIGQRDILDKARGLVIAKFPSAAKSRTNPAPAPKVYARFNSFSDIDNMALYADTVDPNEPPPQKRIVKRKESASKANDELSPIVNAPSQTLIQPTQRATKRKAVEDVAVLEDSQSHEKMLMAHQDKKMRADSDKENDMAREPEAIHEPVLWTAVVPTHKPRPSALMNVSKKRTLKDKSLESNKRLKLDSRDQTASSGQTPSQNISSTRNLSADVIRDEICGPTVTPAGSTAQESPSEPFSDQEELFTHIILEQIVPDPEDDGDRNVSRDVSMDSIPSGIFSVSSEMSAMTLSTPEKADGSISPPEAFTKPMSQADVEPSLRSKPTTMEDNTSPASAVGPKQGTTTCFRIAEALRIRAKAMAAPVLVSEASNPRKPIEIELFARINLTYRSASTRVFVFEDIWFPNKPPVLRAVHKSWQQCEKAASTLTWENSKQSTEGGLMCRAVISLDTSRSTSSTGDVQGEVLCLRAAEWDEVDDVRSMVEPQHQEL